MVLPMRNTIILLAIMATTAPVKAQDLQAEFNAVNELFRGAADSARWGIKPLCLGLGATFGYDLFMYSDALLLRELDIQVWAVRGAVHALAIPLILVASARNRNWTIDVAVSRQIVFGSTALILSGL